MATTRRAPAAGTCRTPHGVRGLKLQAVHSVVRYGGRTPHGVRGLKYGKSLVLTTASAGRTPHGVRGLKYVKMGGTDVTALSHPARGAWIEIVPERCRFVICGSHPARGAWIEIWSASHHRNVPGSRTPHGVRGLKLFPSDVDGYAAGRTPHGVRGLKCICVENPVGYMSSHPARGAWIEIPGACSGQVQ